MSEPPTTRELCEVAGLAVHQAADVLRQLSALRQLVEITGVDLGAATRQELKTDLSQTILALHSLQLAVYEPRAHGAG